MTKLVPGRRRVDTVFAVYVCLVVLALAAGSCGGLEEHSWKSHKKPPRVSFEQVRYEAGDIRQGTVVKHDFRFRNLGDLDLTIDRTRSTPECVATQPMGRIARANGTGVVHAEWDTSGLAGEVRRTITVYTNDPHKRTVLLTLVGNVLSDVVVEPNALYLGPVTHGSLASKTFRVTLSSKSIRIGATSEDNPYVTLHSKTSPDQPNVVELEVHVADHAPFGPFDEVVRMPTNNPRQPVLRLRVAGILQPNVTASPDRLTFGDIARNGNNVRRSLVRNRGHNPVRVTAAEWEPRFGSVEVETLRQGRRYRIDATIARNVAPGDISSVIRLTTDDPEQPRIEIPIEGRVVEETETNSTGKNTPDATNGAAD